MDMNVMVTGARGFIGKNLVVALRRKGAEVWEFDLDSPPEVLQQGLAAAEVVFHLAGVNRPERVEEFIEGNTDLTRQICERLRASNRQPLVVLSSSTQAGLDNPYGVSKRLAEEEVREFGASTGAPVAVFRLPGVFGKWCRSNYNSVVATFCHNIARDLPVTISDPAKELELVYIDDVVSAFLGVLEGRLLQGVGSFCRVEPTFRVSLGELAARLRSFRDSRQTLQVADSADHLNRSLYATYISYLPEDNFAYALDQRVDERGELAELLKSPHLGQIFVSRTRPGILRGNHYHDTKVEKFAVLDGEAVIRFRQILGSEIIEYPVSGKDFRVVDIPPGYTHSIENIGKTDLIVLFWANEIFDPAIPDTYFLNVRLE